MRATVADLEDITAELEDMTTRLVRAEDRADMRVLSDRVFESAQALTEVETALRSMRQRLLEEETLTVSSTEDDAHERRIADLERVQERMLATIEQLVAAMPKTTSPALAAARVTVAERAVVAQAGGDALKPIERLVAEAETLAYKVHDSVDSTPMRLWPVDPIDTRAAAGGAGAGAPPAPRKRPRSQSVELCDVCDGDPTCSGYGCCGCKCHQCTRCFNECSDDRCTLQDRSASGLRCACHGRLASE